jgi:Fe2+ transport system protein FeoA
MVNRIEHVISEQPKDGRGEDLVPLSDVNEGRRVTVRSVSGGQGLVCRLAALGLMTGASIVVLRNAGGPFLLAVKGTRIAIGRGMAYKILVT